MDYKTALVTGGSSGIGAGVVRKLRQHGLDVHAVALPGPELDAVAAETGAQAHGVDVRDIDALRRIVDALDIDVLVNNAGVLGELKPFQDHGHESIDALIDVNLRANIHLTHLVLPQMLARDRGHIFLTGSMAGKHPTANTAVYGATKAALHSFAEGLRMDLLGAGIRLTVLVPGRVQTHIYDNVFGGHDQASAALYEHVDAVKPVELAQAIWTTLTLPPHVDVTVLEINATMQAFGGSQTPKA